MVHENQSVKCVIFDCDGVLIDSETLCCKALVNVFSDYSDEVTLEACQRHFKGGKVAEILTDTIRRFGIRVRLDDVESLYRDEVSRIFEQELKPTDGVEELLKKLEQQGTDFCVVSNSQKAKTEKLLRISGLLDRFEGKVFSAFEANSWKPDPDLLLYAAMRMGYSPDECLYVDDTEKGVTAGLNAGIRTLHFQSGFNESSAEDPDAKVIRDLSVIHELMV